MGTNTKKSACILCDSNCGVVVEVKGRSITKIKPDKSHPVSKGYICQKAGRLNYYQNHDQRLSAPLRRRTDGTFEEIPWETAVTEIAAKLASLRDLHGGHSIAYYGGGGQGNHLQGMSGGFLRKALGTRYVYSALAQEKTGDFWVAGQIFGRQDVHLTPDQLEHADLAVFWGTNPWMAHGFPEARNVLKDIVDHPSRRMVVIDPKRTKTAEMADLYLPVKPGRDAFLLTALIAELQQIGGLDDGFMEKWTTGWEEISPIIKTVDTYAYAKHAGVNLEDVQTLARWIADTDKVTFRHDLGLEQSLHSTLNSYLEKLLILITGSFGREGTNTFHTALAPLIGHSEPDADGNFQYATKVTGMMPIAGLYPPNILPQEIDSEHPQRLRGLVIDSANPLVSAADTAALTQATQKLDIMVTIDVAMTETARQSHYVLPAASQFEKWEATFFNFGFPVNHFHLRAPVFAPAEGCLPESEIYRRLTEALGERAPQPIASDKFPELDDDGRLTLAPLYMLTRRFASANEKAVRAAGHSEGDFRTLGDALFAKILKGPTAFSKHEFEDNFSPMWMKHKDRKFHLAVGPMLDELRDLESELANSGEDSEYPFVLMAGERRSYNANTIFRNPEWRRKDNEGSLHIHPQDARELSLQDGDRALCRSPWGSVEVTVEFNDRCRRGMCTLPHGYGLTYGDKELKEKEYGPYVNRLTGKEHCDSIAKTPFHKYVPVAIAAFKGANANAKADSQVTAGK